jgi:hypothetical protein
MNLCTEARIILGSLLLAVGCVAGEAAQSQIDVYSTAEYKRLNESFSAACRQNELLRKEVLALQKVSVYAELTPEDRAKIDQVIKLNDLTNTACKAAAVCEAVLICVLSLIIPVLSCRSKKWKERALQLENEKKIKRETVQIKTGA